MNRSIVRFLISKLLLIEAGLLVVPLIVALIYQEDAKVFTSILGTMAILLFIGVLGTLFKPKNYRIYTKEGMLIVALCWVLWLFFRINGVLLSTPRSQVKIFNKHEKLFFEIVPCDSEMNGRLTTSWKKVFKSLHLR